MPTIAVVGAGPLLGLSIGKLFGAHGYQVALVARNRSRLDEYVAQLAQRGVAAAGFPADVADRAALVGALSSAADRFGRIDVLEYSPYSGLARVGPAELTVDALAPQIEEILYGAVAATQAVLPAMLTAGAGTLLYTVGGGAINPYPFLGAINTAQAALRNWVHNLHASLADRGVQAADVVINVGITTTPAPSAPQRHPDELAESYWDLHTSHRDDRERLIGVAG